MKYTIDEITDIIMDEAVCIPIEEFFNADGNLITKKQYGKILIKYLCKQLKEKYK